METPLVTIGAINYNNSNYLIETLDSIKNQSYQQIELIIVDDCSTDESLYIIRKWLHDYDKFYKLILHEKNLGVCATCNDVLKNAKGKYISIIATDDIMMPKKIENQVKILESSTDDICAVYSDAYLINENGEERYGWFIQQYRQFENLPSGNIYELLIKGNFLPAMSLMIKKSSYDFIGYFDESLFYEDYDMWLRLSKKYKFVPSNYVSVKYRVRETSLSFGIKNWDLLTPKIYLKHISHPFAKKKVEQFVFYLYSTSKLVELNDFFSFSNQSRFIKRIALFEKIKIPRSIGVKIIGKLKTW